ncbi:MAG TPA: aminotransferase class III-fold pyridoxal phosphate-dependent enzyme [Kofleriaceae bacterium]|jgi:taurine--2-oxoglutarate transaminase|nr:aminotransferase class III-fold pyridoxal phosphate-dependent enzyme [Kofleriaceae bacterium]
MSEYPFFFTWSAQNAAKPVELAGGDGAWFTLKDGSRWLDLGALAYQVNVGHGNKRIVEAIKRQADELCLSTPNAVFPAKVELAERLLKMAGPSFSKVFFTLGGAEANENALKMARLYSGRLKNIARYRSYHGASMGALSLTGDWRRAPVEPGIPGVVHVQDCYCDRCPFGKTVDSCARECATNIGDVMRLEADGAKPIGGRGPAGAVAAVFLEPVPGANGVLVPPPEYWPLVRQACDDEGALLVADEVLTGFGRTGKAFGHQHWGVTPDLITIAKGLSSGYATIGAVIVSDKIARYFDENVLAAGLTYYAHPLACAAAVETLKVYEDERMFEHAAALGPVLRRELEAIKTRIAPSTFVRSLGLLGALEIEAPSAAWLTLGRELAARKLSLHVDGKRGTAIFSPPLCITEQELVTGMRAFGDAAVAAFGPRP